MFFETNNSLSIFFILNSTYYLLKYKTALYSSLWLTTVNCKNLEFRFCSVMHNDLYYVIMRQSYTENNILVK